MVYMSRRGTCAALELKDLEVSGGRDHAGRREGEEVPDDDVPDRAEVRVELGRRDRRFLRGLQDAEIWGRKCDGCERVMVPPRMYCERCYRPTDRWVRLQRHREGRHLLDSLREL